MSMFVTFKDSSDREFHVGDREIRFLPAEEVVEVQVDGHELEFILNNFSNVPFSKKSFQIWSGEMARFIIENW